jgi:hypothetical protein
LNVAHDQFHVKAMRQRVEGLLRVGCFNHRVARIPELVGNYHPHQNLILDNENYVTSCAFFCEL